MLAAGVAALGVSRASASAPGGASQPGAAADAGWRLRRLIAASDEAALRLDPMPRVAPDFARGAPVFVDPLSDGYAAALRTQLARDVRGLRAIDPAHLGEIDRIAFEVFAYRLERERRRFDSGLFKVERRAPLNPSFGLHIELADYVSGTGAPFAARADFRAGLERIEGFAGHLDGLVRRLREGLATGQLQSQVVVDKTVAQCDAMLALPAGATPFHAALQRLPESMSPRERARVSAAYERAISRSLLPAYARLRQFLVAEYRPRALAQPGRWAMRDGAALYAFELEHHTTMATTADGLHRRGLEEVARIRDEMERVRARIGTAASLPEFFEFIRSDRRFYYTKPEELVAHMREIEGRIWQGMPRLFARRPRAPFAVRALPALGGQRGTGYYRPGPPDGVTPGVLWFNMAMLGTRPIPTLETLTLHEGIPGHHYQITLVLEDAALPEILRFGGLTAYVEGWGLYSESLGPELGLFTDPYQWFGHLDMEMLRAVRLVVDTGLHAFEWDRQRAIDYMLANTSMAPRDVEVEIDRYIAAPGQACAYKPGELKLQELRLRSAAALRSRFDVRDFHAQVLDTGAVPLAVLESKIDRWLAATA